MIRFLTICILCATCAAFLSACGGDDGSYEQEQNTCNVPADFTGPVNPAMCKPAAE